MNETPCCMNCVNKTFKGEGHDNLVLYCEAKERFVKNDGMCQWYDRDKKIWNRRKN